jgi:beta-glucosidase
MKRHLHALGCMLLFAATGPGPDPARGGEPDPEQGRGDPGTDARVEALLASMTLDERIGQMTQVDLLALKDKADIARFAIGSVLSGGESDPPDITPAGWAAAHDECQSWALKSRLKIPILYGIDAVHGHNNVDGAVIFPHNIGLGATRDPALVEQAGRVTAVELAATGTRWAFAPCVAVARDERWGRTYESFGESPELVAELGAAAVRGLQGRRLSDRDAVLACAKHFLGDGGTRDGVDQGETVGDEAALRRIHLPGYPAAIRAGVGSVMISYSRWGGTKMHAHQRLLTDVLKGELGFRGIVVSDWAAIDQLAPEYPRAVETAINAGLDMAMIPYGPGQKNNYVEFIGILKQLVTDGRVPRSRVDDAVRRILRMKLELGLFERPFAEKALIGAVGSEEHRRVARECVRRSLVLLKNEGHALPLSRRAKRLHVAGRAADDLGMQCGGWTIEWQGKTGRVIRGGTTILEALRASARDTEVTYSPDGAGVAGSDAVVVVIGEEPYAEMKGDRRDLSLRPEDLAVVRKAREARVPVVTVLISGRPLIIGPAIEASDAFLAAWLPGSEGQGVADVLFGDAKPTGKLPHTWPRTMDQIPINAGDPDKGEPLFPFGYGLSY